MLFILLHIFNCLFCFYFLAFVFLFFSGSSFSWIFNIIIDNQVLRAISDTKYVRKKQPFTVKIFNYLQNIGATNYNCESLEDELSNLRNTRIIDETFQIVIPIEQMLNFQEDNVDIASDHSDFICLNTQSSQVD